MRIRSQPAVRFHALETGLDLTLSLASGLLKFLQTNLGPSDHSPFFPSIVSILTGMPLEDGHSSLREVGVILVSGPVKLHHKVERLVLLLHRTVGSTTGKDTWVLSCLTITCLDPPLKSSLVGECGVSPASPTR